MLRKFNKIVPFIARKGLKHRRMNDVMNLSAFDDIDIMY
jgi:hypothetical protein